MDDDDDANAEDAADDELAAVAEAEEDEEMDEEEKEKMAAKRSRIIEEIIKTETDYVGDLTMLVEGYMKPMQKRASCLLPCLIPRGATSHPRAFGHALWCVCACARAKRVRY